MADMPPWWAPATPEPDTPRLNLRDHLVELFDALFGKLETFHHVEAQGSWFICRPEEVWEYLGTSPDGDTYTVTEVTMTRREFERLPEFTGF